MNLKQKFAGLLGRGISSALRNPYSRNLGALDRSRYFFFQVAPQLYSRGWVDPVPDPLLPRKSGNAGNRTRTSGSVARNSDYLITEAVYFLLRNIYKLSSYLTRNTIHLRCVPRNSDQLITEALVLVSNFGRDSICRIWVQNNVARQSSWYKS
jgi:hypothetical protein